MLAALVASGFAGPAQVGPNAITLATNRVTSATTNTSAGTEFFVGGQRSTYVVLSAYSTNASAVIGVGTTLLVQFEGSQDNVTYFDAEYGTNWDVTLPKTTTNLTRKVTTLDTAAVQWLRPKEIRNAATNMTLYPTATYHYK